MSQRKKTTKLPKLKLKTGDTVKVIAGNEKGKTGEIISVEREKNRALVKGLRIVKRHTKPSASQPQGGIVEKEAPIHISNLKLVDPATGETTRVGRRRDDSGKLQRYAKKTGEFIQQ